MAKQKYHSFQDLGAFRFFADANLPSPAERRPAPKQCPSAVPDVVEESALFLEAVAGSVDASAKCTPDLPQTEPPSRKERKARLRAVLPDTPKAAASPAGSKEQSATTDRTAMRAGGREETRLFAEAMSGVTPLRARGRDLAPPAQAPSVTQQPVDIDELLLGTLEFSLEYTDEFVEGHVFGLDPLVMEKLKAGAYSPEGHVDLHGQNMEQAYATLAHFIKHAYRNGKRHLIVVTGRGKNSPGGVPVLRERVQAWFTRDPFKRVILGFCSAKQGDGGVGALYVLLRKRRKNQGKIVWNTTPTEEELLI